MRRGPLAGVRVLEMAGVGPTPFCGMLLADLGADVVRVDRPGGGMTLVPWDHDVLGRGKRSVEADLRTDAGRERVHRLVPHADVMIEGFRPGVAERLGIGPEICLQRNPRLVYGRMTGWGQDGPLSARAGHDINYIALTGALHSIGSAHRPSPPLTLVGDFGGGAMYLAVGVLAALHEARLSGRGQVVDAAIVDGAAHLMNAFYNLSGHGGWTDAREQNLLDGGAPFYGVYETSDGAFMAVGAIESAFHAAFMTLIGLDEDSADRHDRAQWPQLRRAVAARFLTRSRAEWINVFRDTDACVTPVLRLEEAPRDPHLRARETFIERDGMVQAAPAPRFSRTPGAVEGPPCRPGQHTDQVLAEWSAPDTDAQSLSGEDVCEI